MSRDESKVFFVLRFIPVATVISSIVSIYDFHTVRILDHVIALIQAFKVVFSIFRVGNLSML